MRRKILIGLAVAVGLPLLAVVAVVLYLNVADLGRYRDTVERMASAAIGRELRIGGEFRPELGFTTRVVASDVTLANPDGWHDPHMVTVGRLEAELDLSSLVFGPLTINDLTASGVQVLLEADDRGRATWHFDSGTEAGAEVESVDVRIAHAAFTDVGLVFKDPSLPRPIELTRTDLELRTDETGTVDLELKGQLNGAPLQLAGRLGTLGNLLAAGAVEPDLRGRLGDVELAFHGRIEDLASLAGADIVAEAGGPDMAAVGDRFGIPRLPAAPFRVKATASPLPSGSAVALAGELDRMTATVDGSIDSLLSPGDIDVAVSAAGPDVSVIGTLEGIPGLPADPFTVSGKIRWQGLPVSFDGFVAQVGDNRLSLEGVLGAPPALLDSDFRIEASGPNIAALTALAGIRLPEEDFEISGRLVRAEEGLRLEGIAARIGTTNLTADGIVGEPPGFAGTELTVSASGPDIASYGGLLGVDLPAEPFEAAGRLAPKGDEIMLEGVELRLGSNIAHLEGRIAATPGIVGTELRLSANGPGLDWLAPIIGLEELPEAAYRVDGGLGIVARGYRLENVEVDLGWLSVEVDGVIASSPDLEGTEVTAAAHGTDISHLASLAGMTGVPPQPFRAAAVLEVTGDGYLLESLEAALGDVELKAEGRVGRLPDLVGTHLQLEADVPRMSALEWAVDGLRLPQAPISASGGIGIGPDGYRLEGVVAELAGIRLAVDGLIVAAPRLAGTDISVALDGPDLGDAGRIVEETGLVQLPALPAEPYAMTGGLRIGDAGYELRTVRATLGTATAHLDGTIGQPPGLVGSDLTVDVDGPNASLFSAITGVVVPVAPFRLSGRIERGDTGIRFHEMAAQLGEYHATADGLLGEPPGLIGTDFEIHANGPSLALFEQLFDLPMLPDEPFAAGAHLDGNPQRFKGERVTLRIGGSDLRGEFRLDVSGRPTLQARLESDRVDVAKFLRQRADRKRALEEEGGPPATEKRDRVIPDTPFELGVIRGVDADVVWKVADLRLAVERITDITIDLDLQDGRLKIGPLAATGSAGGRLNGELLLEPAGEAYALTTGLSLEGGRLVVSRHDEDPSQRPPMDVYIQYSGSGTSAREMAASSDGFVAVVLGEGVMDNSLVDMVTADILLTLLETLNPFSKTEDHSRLQCAVVLATFDDGFARLDPMAVQTDRMTMLGGGTIDLETEKIKLNWVTKPRKGLGLSASMITNPYISLGGTLADPDLALKPLEAVTTTGIAVATGGLSILARGLFDRITAENKVCDKAMKDGRKLLQERGVQLRQ